jgi:D-beta-D-heptose 7-phosphate kinase / D-beta-D-heptose 1-phosphate adenosyltransferase
VPLSLRWVDLVVVFGEDRILRPELLVKGDHSRPEDVVGFDLIRSWGGELYMAKTLPGRSTALTVAGMTDAKANRNLGGAKPTQVNPHGKK